jgi:hypothetical protein
MNKLILDVLSLLCLLAGIVLGVETLAIGGTVSDAGLWLIGAACCAGMLQTD